MVDSSALEQLLSTLDLRLKALAVCEIGADWRLIVDPFQSVVCHFVARGRGYFEVAGNRTPIEAGTIIIVPPETPKSISGPDPIAHEVSALHVCNSYTDGLLAFRACASEPALVLGCATISASCGGSVQIFEGLPEPLLTSAGSDSLLFAAFETLLDELTDPKIGATVMAECLMKQALIYVLRDQLSSDEGGRLLEHLGDPRILRAVTAIITAPGQPHSIERLAAVAGMSRSSFVTHFLRVQHKTPGEFLQEVRMHSAARLLVTSELPIKCLAGVVGYASRSQFSRAFKSVFGVDPTAYRLRERRVESSGRNQLFELAEPDTVYIEEPLELLST